MSLSLSRLLRQARKIAVCNVDVTIDINFPAYCVYWRRYFEIYHKRPCVRSVCEVYRRPFRVRRPLDDRKSNRRRIYMKRARANPLPLSTSRLFHRVLSLCSRHPICLDEAVLQILLYSDSTLIEEST